jgi:putative endonuclease
MTGHRQIAHGRRALPDLFGGAWFVYMVRCADGSLYTGATNRLVDRVVAHDAGRGARYTRSRRPIHLVWSRLIGPKGDALREEARIKRLPKAQKEEMLPWHSPTPEVRQANAMLREHARLCPPLPEGAHGAAGLLTCLTLTGHGVMDERDRLVRRYAWGTPTEAALRAVLSDGPRVVEMGAGTGYWAWLLQKLGGDVVAYDKFSDGRTLGMNPWCGDDRWAEVRHGTPSILHRHPDRTLLLCWPPYDSSMALDCLHRWKGRTLVFVGDKTAAGNYDFHDSLQDRFWPVRALPLPSWPGIRDFLEVWRRCG